jgi:hypothetical protein
VIRADLVAELQEEWPHIPRDELTSRPHAVYQLGLALPGMPVKNGKQYRESRLWVLLDQLLTSDTLAGAHPQSVALAASP